MHFLIIVCSSCKSAMLLDAPVAVGNDGRAQFQRREKICCLIIKEHRAPLLPTDKPFPPHLSFTKRRSISFSLCPSRLSHLPPASGYDRALARLNSQRRSGTQSCHGACFKAILGRLQMAVCWGCWLQNLPVKNALIQYTAH